MKKNNVFKEIVKGLVVTVVVFFDPGNTAKDRVFCSQLDGD
jgi:hypothetical protein